MDRFGINVLPDIVNALIMTSVLSAANNLVFSGARTLYGMSLEGKAPKVLSQCNRYGLPYNAVAVTMAFCALAFLQVNNSSATVLNWLVSCISRVSPQLPWHMSHVFALLCGNASAKN